MLKNRKKYCIFLLSTLFLIIGCEQKNTPPDIWSRETMVNFLTEAQLLEAKISIKKLPTEQRDSLYLIYYEELFAAFNTDRETWAKNMEYYKNDPETLDEIYTEVISRLNLLESEIHNSTTE
jgi:hypothetical protein